MKFQKLNHVRGSPGVSHLLKIVQTHTARALASVTESTSKKTLRGEGNIILRAQSSEMTSLGRNSRVTNDKGALLGSGEFSFIFFFNLDDLTLKYISLDLVLDD